MAGPVAAHDGQPETVTKTFETTIPNVSGKSLIALKVNYAPGPASPFHTHGKSSFIYAYVISGAIEVSLSRRDQGMAKVSLAPHMPNMMMKATNPAAVALAIRKRSAKRRATPWASSTDRPPAARCERTKKTARP